MEWVWLVPATAGVIGLAVLAAFVRRAGEEAAGLRGDASRFDDLRHEVEGLGSDLRDLATRRKGAIR